MSTITYTAHDEASRALAHSDPALGLLIEQLERVEVSAEDDLFLHLVQAIVWQQLSDKAATTIWNRLAAAVEPTPASLVAAPMDTLRSLGLSQRKAEYVQGIARAVLGGDLDLEALPDLDDEAVISTLTELRGVGRWTAEMVLIFALKRPDVLAVDDYGLRCAAGRLVGAQGPLTPSELAELGLRWSPHRSAACLWLWKSL